MYTFASSYISGLNSEVEKWLKQDLKNVEIIKNLDGLILYKSNSANFSLPYMNNNFLVLATKDTPRGGGKFESDLKNFINQINIDYNQINAILPYSKTFKILAFDKNQPTKIDYKTIEPLEIGLQKHTKLKQSKAKHDIDIQLIRRSENIMLCLLKISNNRQTEKTLKQGELRPELAYSLARLAEISPNDIVMDMFTGSGAIPKAIVKHFKYNMVFASDNDQTKIEALKKEYKNNNKKLYIKQRDALDLSYFKDEFINKIVTDPPWNIFNKQKTDFVGFYKNMLKEMYRILSDNGKLVILMGNIEEFEQALLTASFSVENKYNILVNGKKANIYVLKKIDI